jgi:hypothetical protein
LTRPAEIRASRSNTRFLNRVATTIARLASSTMHGREPVDWEGTMVDDRGATLLDPFL